MLQTPGAAAISPPASPISGRSINGQTPSREDEKCAAAALHAEAPTSTAPAASGDLDEPGRASADERPTAPPGGPVLAVELGHVSGRKRATPAASGLATGRAVTAPVGRAAVSRRGTTIQAAVAAATSIAGVAPSVRAPTIQGAASPSNGSDAATAGPTGRAVTSKRSERGMTIQAAAAAAEAESGDRASSSKSGERAAPARYVPPHMRGNNAPGRSAQGPGRNDTKMVPLTSDGLVSMAIRRRGMSNGREHWAASCERRGPDRRLATTVSSSNSLVLPCLPLRPLLPPRRQDRLKASTSGSRRWR